MIDAKYLLYSIYPPFILSFGLIGNFLGLLIMKRKKMKKIGPVNIYRYLFIMDSVYLCLILEPYFETEYEIDFCTFSSWSCKLYSYLSYLLQVISPMLLVFISIEKLISIRFQKKKMILRKYTVQLFYFLSIMLFSSLFYLPVYHVYELSSHLVSQNTSNLSNSSNLTISVKMCSFIKEEFQEIVSYMDFIVRVIIPFFLMSLFTLLLIITIFNSRKKTSRFKTRSRHNQTFSRDIRFAITSILLNIIFLIFQLPLSIYVLFPDYFSDLYYMFDIYLLYACYSTNFYLILISNTLFRKEFYLMFKFRFHKNSNPTWV